MKLINKTNWDTRDLRKILLECIRRDGCREDLVIEVATLRKDARGRVINGEAFIGGMTIWLRLKDPTFVLPRDRLGRLKRRIAQATLHEIAHTRGDDHKDMISSLKIDVPWVQDFELRPKSNNEKPKRDLRSERYQRVLAGIKRNETRLKRTQTILKKLYKKKKYYERTEAKSDGEISAG